MSQAKPFSEIIREWAEIFMHRSFRDFKRFMDESGLSLSQASALMHLYHRDQCDVSDMGEHIGVSNAAASQMVDRMVQLGLLERVEDTLDRRVKQLSITAKGRELIEGGIQARCRWMEELTEALSAQQQDEIAPALMMLTNAAQKLDSD